MPQCWWLVHVSRYQITTLAAPDTTQCKQSTLRVETASETSIFGFLAAVRNPLHLLTLLQTIYDGDCNDNGGESFETLLN